MDISKIVIHENKDQYSISEALDLEQAYKTLYAKAQGEEITLDETRVIVAYKRYQQEGNFKIVAEKKSKPPKIPKEPKEKVPKVPRVKKPKALTKTEIQTLLMMRELLEAGQITLETVPADKREFYELNKDRV